MDLDDLRFSAEHVWVRLEDDHQVVIGVTEEAIRDKDEITRLRLPSEGDEFVKDEAFGRLTTAKPTVIRLYAPVTGEVIEVNEDLLDVPEMLLEDPYEEGWLLRVEMLNLTDYDNLMTHDEYEDFLREDYVEEDEEEELADEIEDELDEEEEEY
ncbi:MAG: glycine cleavage system protein H [Thermodesulfobacteriota bacterium]